jgi:3-oxoacyl-[acyl-carrier protein] reductase
MFETRLAGLAGRTALVTGGSRGIGAGIARALAAQGANVMVCGRDRAALARVADEIRSNGGEAESAMADVTDPDAVEALRLAAEARFGAVELVVACAGGDGVPKPLHKENAASWRRTLDANLTSAFLTLKTFLPSMCDRRSGAVVTMASSAGRQLGGASAPYAAAKAGLLSLTRQAALEVAGHGVRINAVAPSAIITDRFAAQPAELRQAIAQGFPLKRLGTVDDVTAATLFLLSDAASWITGATIDVAGGRVMM